MNLVSLGCCAAVSCASVAAANPHDDFNPRSSRVWTNTRTGERTEGSLSFVRDGKVTVTTPLGNHATIELAELAAPERAEVDAHVVAVRAANEPRDEQAPAAAAPLQAAIFEKFAPFVRTRFDERWLYVESDGRPHPPLEMKMMVGITSWQQQVPLPQNYTGANAWQIPLKPELAEHPIPGRSNLMKGAVALAANGIPIFNALNNRGVDSMSIGELDEFGGHCGRADDYHYHAAPLALERVVGKGNPIAYALDGFPIHGLFDPKAKSGDALACPNGSHAPLDELNGHFFEVPKGEGLAGGTRSYHYHASRTFPYINGGLRGKAELSGPGPENEVVPQAHANPVRPALLALRGAKITGFEQTGPEAWSLRYEIGGKPSFVNYRVLNGGKVSFEFVGADGSKRVDDFFPRARRGEGGAARGGEPRGTERPQRTPPASSALSLECDGVGDDGMLRARHTCDGDSVMPGFSWSNLPSGTKSLALTIHHITPDNAERVYLVMYGIPPDTNSLSEAERLVGHLGLNSVTRRAEYAPPCSQGPGEKIYSATIYALSAEPEFKASSAVTRPALLDAMKPITLGTASAELKYSRPQSAAEPERERGGGERGKRGLRDQMTAFKTDVPSLDYDTVLVQPTANSMGISVRTSSDRLTAIEYARPGAAKSDVSAKCSMKAGVPATIRLTELAPDTDYTYRLLSWSNDGSDPQRGDMHQFHTPRALGAPFAFVVQADSHLDQGVTPKAYEQTLANMVAAKPDFLVDLGDTFMTDKRGQDFERSLPQYDAQRYYFSLACHSMPLFMALGNHDGEKGDAGGGIAAWSYNQRTTRFPPPTIDGAHTTGTTTMKNGRGANYYAFEWGDALVVVLDPFWPTTERSRGGGGGGGPAVKPLEPDDSSWSRTLGREQYDWLAQTLAKSQAKQKFIFIHHLVGGIGGPAARGGVESSPYFEWGGANADGSDGFARHRPGWPTPIHDLLVKHGVAAVFHGHDHLYAHSIVDGIHYQCVPQPGNLEGNTRSAQEYGYVSGTLHGSPGHLRVSMAIDGSAKVELVRTAIDTSDTSSSSGDERGRRRGEASRGGQAESNGAIVDAYEIKPRPHVETHN